MYGLKFDGKHNTDVGVDVILEKARDILPDSEDRIMRIPGSPGAYDFGKDDTEGYIPVRLMLDGDSLVNLRAKARAIAAWLNVSEVKELIFDDEPDKRYMARPTGRVSASQLATTLEASVVFLCPSPLAESITTETASAFPADNDGTAPCPCIITVTMTGAESSLKITLAETGEFVLINHALALHDEVVIDTNTHEVTVNGSDMRADVSYLSDFFKLPPGAFNLETDEAATIEVEWRELYK